MKTQTERDFSRDCMGCWGRRYPSPPVSYGDSATKHWMLCPDCDRDLIEMHGLVWDENGDEWSYHPAERCPFCGAAVKQGPSAYVAPGDHPDPYEYECGCSLWYDGDGRIIDAPIETLALCYEGLDLVHPEFIVAASLGREDRANHKRRNAHDLFVLVKQIVHDEVAVDQDRVNVWKAYWDAYKGREDR